MSLKHLLSLQAVRIGVTTVAVLLSAGLWFLTSQVREQSSQTDVLMVLSHSGGLCPEGPCPTTTERIFTDGRFEGSPQLSPQELMQLRSIIDRTDFTAYALNLNPKCNSYTDGRDLTFAFPGKHPGKSFTPCLLDIGQDDRGIRSIVALLDAHHVPAN